MKAGELSDQVTIQQNSATADSLGTKAPGSWSAITGGSNLWAKIRPAGGREYLNGEKVDASISHVVTLRYLEGVTPRMRLVTAIGSRVLRIASVINVDEADEMLQLQCVEEV